jgi:outer membrane protein assembly factor BamE (lipoprotein component of BamABCDE complex)
MIIFISRRLIYTLLLIFSISGCTQKTSLSQGPFLKIPAIENELQKGKSTKSDVHRILGAPQGMGGAIFPVKTEEHEVWFYQNIEVDNIKSESSYVTMDMHQKILIVFFTKELYDGYFWYTGTIKGTGK